MIYQLVIRPSAEADLAEAHDFYEERQAGLADRFENEVDQILQRIRENPLMYPVTEKPRYRKAALKIFPYCIYYSILDNAIAVIAVHNSHRHPQWWLRRTN